MFRKKEYQPIGPRDDPLDNDMRFINKQFDDVYKDIQNLNDLQKELWCGIHKGSNIYISWFIDIRADAWRVLFKYRPLKNYSKEMLENKRTEYKDIIKSIEDYPEIQLMADEE